nr:nitroreductase family protein [Kineosphaera limosa]
MVRDFDPAPVEEAVVQRALERAVRAPSAGFTQGWDFVVLTSEAERAAFWAATDVAESAAAPEPEGHRKRWRSGVRRAPVLIVVCSRPDAYVQRYARPDKAAVGLGEAAQAWPIPYWDVDAGMAALLMLLSAVDDGIGGLFFGVPAGRHDAVRAQFGIPGDRRLVGVVALGRPATRPRGASSRRSGSGTPHRPAPRPLEDVVHRGHFRACDAPW